jgi:prophage antirepressor-like protein
MTTTLNLRVVRKTGTVSMMVRVFSLRGAHLVSMFANTSVAKLFRKWVLDILDREVEKASTVIQPPDSRYQVRVEIYDKHLKKTDTFYGVAGSYEKIINGIAKRYGYYVEKIISLPVGLF